MKTLRPSTEELQKQVTIIGAALTIALQTLDLIAPSFERDSIVKLATLALQKINDLLISNKGAPTLSSNGIPVCSRHGKPMKSGNYGYYCTSRESDPRFSNKNGYCNAKG